MVGRARSLRFRLTLSYVGVFLLLQVVLLGTVALLRYETSDRAAYLSLEKAARDTIDNLIESGIAWNDQELRRELPAESGMLFVVVRAEDGRILASTDLPEGFEPTFEPRESVPTGPFGPTQSKLAPQRASLVTGKEERLLMITYPFRDHGNLYYVQAAAADPGLARYLGPFFDLVVIGVPVGVLAAMFTAWMITDRALRPLDRLAAAARAVSPAQLGARLPEAGDAEFSNLAEELNSGLARIEAAYRSQDQFLGNVAHELKTPLAVLLLQAQVARMGKRDDADAWRFLAVAEEELKRLSVVVESFLVLARARAAGEDRQRDRVSLHDLVIQAVHNARHQAELCDVRLIANIEDGDADGADAEDDEPVVTGDADLLQAMIDNLVRNAVAHSPRGEAVAIDTGRAGRELWIAVRDRGPGIPRAMREQIFERFVQVPVKAAPPGAADGPSDRAGAHPAPRGTGLGLAIARDVARLHAGRIGIEDREGGGTSLIVRLPATG